MEMREIFIRDIQTQKIEKAISLANAARIMGVQPAAVWRGIQRFSKPTCGFNHHGTIARRYQLGDNVEELSSRAVTFTPIDMSYLIVVDHHPAVAFKTMVEAQEWLRDTFSIPQEDSRITSMMVSVTGREISTHVRALRLPQRSAQLTITPVSPQLHPSLSYTITSSTLLRDARLFSIEHDGETVTLRMGEVFCKILQLCNENEHPGVFMDCARPIYNSTSACKSEYVIFNHIIRPTTATTIKHTVHLPNDAVWYKVGPTKVLMTPDRAKKLNASRTAECVFTGKRGASIRVGVVDVNGAVSEVLPTLCAAAKLAGVSYGTFCNKMRDAVRSGKTRCTVGPKNIMFERMTKRKSDNRSTAS